MGGVSLGHSVDQDKLLIMNNKIQLVPYRGIAAPNKIKGLEKSEKWESLIAHVCARFVRVFPSEFRRMRGRGQACMCRATGQISDRCSCSTPGTRPRN